ncbi:hypothetical protein ACETRX_04140 [Labrys portucalensis]|uniref:Uncharacterized protein n=1 Tax=Labrys neptuniae TaxID=376174 RepID=A0ABV6Z9G7_9HYPH
MEKKSEWPLHLAAGLFVTVLVVIVFWQPMSRGVCPVKGFLTSSESQNCLDFLLNRYQTFIAGILGIGAAIGAAVVAWRGVQRQIAHSEIVLLRSDEQTLKALATVVREARAEAENRLRTIEERLPTQTQVHSDTHAINRSAPRNVMRIFESFAETSPAQTKVVIFKSTKQLRDIREYSRRIKNEMEIGNYDRKRIEALISRIRRSFDRIKTFIEVRIEEQREEMRAQTELR